MIGRFGRIELMPRLIIFLIVLLALGGGGFYIYETIQKQPPKTTTQATKATSSPATSQSSDPCEVLVKGGVGVPPLYEENLEWSEPIKDSREITEYEDISLGKGFSSKKVNGCVTETVTTSSIAQRLRDFYMQNLQNNVWRLVDAADGPDGFYMVYKKGSSYFSMKLLNEEIELFYSD